MFLSIINLAKNIKYISVLDFIDIDYDDIIELIVVISSVIKWIAKTKNDITRAHNNLFSSL